MSDDWFWEGNVQAALARHLEGQGWTIKHLADTATRETGIDLLAERPGQRLAVEVKGYPSNVYARGEKMGQPKPTAPQNQARQWYSHALLSVMLLRHKRPDASIALAFPNYPTYRSLLDRTERSLRLLGTGAFLVHENGGVDVRLPPD